MARDHLRSRREVLAGNPVYLTEGGYCGSTEQKTKQEGRLHDGYHGATHYRIQPGSGYIFGPARARQARLATGNPMRWLERLSS